MSIDSVGMILIPACSWRQAEYPPGKRSRIGEVVVELPCGEAWKPGVNLEKNKFGVASRQRLSTEKTQQTL